MKHIALTLILIFNYTTSHCSQHNKVQKMFTHPESGAQRKDMLRRKLLQRQLAGKSPEEANKIIKEFNDTSDAKIICVLNRFKQAQTVSGHQAAKDLKQIATMRKLMLSKNPTSEQEKSKVQQGSPTEKK